jgi:hypothetical protein
MPEAIVTYCGQPMKVNCDGLCAKAWGIECRPRVQLSEDEDDYAYLSDAELGTAPVDPGTEEGEDSKPLSVAEFPNKWCVRQCERSNRSKPGKSREPLPVLTFSERVPNRTG